ncbi:hypothetical protein HNQ56_004335 [Anaerotaenia torta]|uniref:ChbG/HpnK family deacetylase n=1 Tax=Anaerotaenia torta TaxID=433293 RepID=UPI003D1A243D
MSDRYLIINADDFGICTETNDAIEHLFREGKITSTTVMVCAGEGRDAVSRASKDNRIRMGLHATFNSDFMQEKWRGIAPGNIIPSLLDDDGSFHVDRDVFYKNAKEQEIAIELEAQYDFIKDMGYQPTHIDSHCGTLYGLTGRSFLKEAFVICLRKGLPFRFPKSKKYLTAMFQGNIPDQIDQAHTMAVSYAKELGVALPVDIVTNPFSIRDISSYEQLKNFYLNAVRNTEEGVTELFMHPSGENSTYSFITPEWQKRIWEYRFLLDDELQKVIGQENIKLVSWDNAPFSL